MRMEKHLKNIIFCINIILCLVCVVHISVNGYYILYPDLPDIRVSKDDLQNIDFPLAFKLCVIEKENISARYTNVGYESDVAFFKGKSMYNESLYGWSGHTENGSTISNVEGNVLSIPISLNKHV